jgi:hypothetical protein
MAISRTKLMASMYEWDKSKIAIDGKFPFNWVRSVANILLPIAVIAFLLPSGVSPYSSGDLNSISRVFNNAMVHFNNFIAPAFRGELPVDAVQSAGGTAGPQGGIVYIILNFLTILINMSTVRQGWSLANAITTFIIWACFICFGIVLIWLLLRIIIPVINWFAKARIGIPRFPARELLAILLWPVALVRGLIWLLKTLLGFVASWLSGTASKQKEQGKATLKDIAGLFQRYKSSIPVLPKDPSLFIRYIFARIMTLARKTGAPLEQGPTASQYADSLAARYPMARDAIMFICQWYERIRYGGRTADTAAAHSVRDYFTAVTKSLKNRR